MSDNKKYYYLKLKEDFFNSEEMMILESMKNGAEYQNVYLKLCLLSLKSDGALIFKNMIPYSVEMLSSVLRVNIDTIKTAIELFQKLGLISVTDTETIYMTDIQTLVGQSSTEAERVKKYRQSLANKKTNQISEPEVQTKETQTSFKEEKKEECTDGVQMYEECTEMLQNCTPENRDKRIEFKDKSLNNNNSEKVAVISNKSETKKSPLLEREPVNDLERIEKLYLQNYQQLYNTGQLVSSKPIINWLHSRKLTNEAIKQYGFDLIYSAVQKSKDNKFCIEHGYVLTTILSAGVLAGLVNGGKTKNSVANDEFTIDGEITF